MNSKINKRQTHPFRTIFFPSNRTDTVNSTSPMLELPCPDTWMFQVVMNPHWKTVLHLRDQSLLLSMPATDHSNSTAQVSTMNHSALPLDSITVYWLSVTVPTLMDKIIGSSKTGMNWTFSYFVFQNFG